MSKRKGKLERATEEEADDVAEKKKVKRAEKKKVKRAEKVFDEKQRRYEERARRKSFEDFCGWRKQKAKHNKKTKSDDNLCKLYVSMNIKTTSLTLFLYMKDLWL